MHNHSSRLVPAIVAWVLLWTHAAAVAGEPHPASEAIPTDRITVRADLALAPDDERTEERREGGDRQAEEARREEAERREREADERPHPDAEHRERKEAERREREEIERREREADERPHPDAEHREREEAERREREEIDRREREEAEQVTVLHIHPGDLPRPAMRFSLLPPFLDQVRGNAAPLYMKAFLLLDQRNTEPERWEEIHHWLDVPAEAVPRGEAWEVAGEHFEAPLHYAAMAARRSTCQWDLPIREEGNIFGMLLPELQTARNLGRVIALRARLQIIEHEYEEAIHTLQTGFALARDISRQPTLVSGLVGIAIARLMFDQVELLIQQPEAPSLYWTIAALPDPVADLRAGLEMEAQSLFLVFPELRHVEEGPRPPEEWEHLLHEVSERLMELTGSAGGENQSLQRMFQEMAQTAYLAAVYPAVRRQLIEWGHPEEEVERMSPAQGILLHTVRTYTELRDGMFKWFHVPYWQAEQGMLEAEQRLHEEGRRREIVPLASLLLPAIGRCRITVAQLERRAAAIQCVEAIRTHAARLEGHLPERLESTPDLPLPIDPVTGRPFVYHFEGEMAVLVGEATREVARVEYHVHLVR